ncbi:hypothetical protein HMH01_17385 [Halovulum dunhuangense]|uniref:Dynamin N-terminal domain-containing protein n=1 Tax=Halovulum dunhuangense TaxID=1505036 RepID=A0A849L7Y9_9RHOB|nr:dynamin family protein [Halovulum dunhuangense]NNU82212.1 hypothetical protein [Halovulum dunhuangense]
MSVTLTEAPETLSRSLACLRAQRAARPVVAVMGEFSAGKSTLLNLLLDSDLLPAQVTATQMPALWLAAGRAQGFGALGHDGSYAIHPMAGLRGRQPERDAILTLRVDAPVLSGMDLIDTPGISDPLLPRLVLREISAVCDFVLWCTPAAQAWRQSEKALWESLPSRLRAHSLLVVTRADKLGEGERAKVARRLGRETAGLFATTHFLATPDALAARKSGDRALWEASGAEALLAALARTAAQARPATNDGALADTGAFPWPDEDAPGRIFNDEDCPEPGQGRTSVTSTANRGRTAETGTPGEKDDQDVLKVRKLIDQVTLKARGPAMDATPPETETRGKRKDTPMNVTTKMGTDISGLSQIAGFIGGCLVDSDTGLMLGSEGGANFDLEAAAAGNTEVVKAKNAAMAALGLDDAIEDILITLGKQFHLIRPLANSPTVFLYVALDKKAANLGMARIQVKNIEKTLEL